jgi:hypothetical protein
MASFESFKDKALSYLAVTMIAGIGYQLNVLNQKVDRLMEVSAGTVVRIDGLEREIYKTGYTPVMPPFKLPKQVKMLDVVGIRPEQDNKVRKYLTKI